MENDTRYETSAEAAASWWAEQIGGSVVHLNGDREFSGLVATTMAGMLADKHPVTEEQVDQFRASLLAVIRREQEKHPSGYCGLHTDYHPDGWLREAADGAGIDSSRFPWKTNSWVWPHKFEVSAGYAAGVQVVWSDPTLAPSPLGEVNDE